ncbi:hypothetical protein [Bradyrhizobium sp. 2TAF24]|uniref:hypothetical protein n=1 Tax=Bradyrhizobium sp. 2TAF24 TaxID=3233011 RepID=UPI003F900EDB
MSLLLGIVVTMAVLAAAFAAVVAFIVTSLSRSARLIAARTGRGRLEAVIVHPLHPRPLRRRAIRFMQHRSAPLVAVSRGMLRSVLHIA